MTTPKPKLPDHPSATLQRLNPHLYPQGSPVAQDGAVGALVSKSTTGSGGRLKKARQPNKTEQRYLDICAARQKCGEIDNFRYEGMRLKWGVDKDGNCMHYTGDVVIFCGKEITIIEVKGAHVKSRDIVRFKGCRAAWPEFHFEMWQWKSGEWRRIL